MSNHRYGLRTASGNIKDILQEDSLQVARVLRSRTRINQGDVFFSDLFVMPDAAYSLRKLTPNAINCIRVRRSNDNAEQDIGFINSKPNAPLNTGQLLQFVGANNGFITTWYDQSTNVRNGTQTTGANQPRIVNGGVIDTSGGLPAFLWTNGSGQRLINSAISLSQSITTFIVTKLSAATGINASVIYDSFNNTPSVLYHTGTTEFPFNTLALACDSSFVQKVFGSVSSANIEIITALLNSSNSKLRINSSQVGSGNASTNGLSGISIGDIRGNPNVIVSGYDFSGHISELIIYGADKTTNFIDIETNINTYYNVF
jgi:hypothetical protein